jgi:acyl-CoA reductase-like NAD-dependent aldehyde dehydrogenase
MSSVETKEAIDAAAKAFKTWSKTTAKVGRVTNIL